MKICAFLFLPILLFAADFEKEITPYSGGVNVLTGEYVEATSDLSLNGPFPLVFGRIFTASPQKGIMAWQFNHPGVIYPEEVVSKETVPKKMIHYEVDENNLLSSVKITDRRGKTVFHEASLTRSSDGDLILKADDGRKVHYRLLALDPARDAENILISEVIYPDKRSLKYKYRQHPIERKYLLSKVETPGGGFIETEYYDNKYNNVGGELVVIDNPQTDFRIGRVKLQRASTGPDGAPQIFQTFFYENGKTIVKDPLGNQKVYTFDENGQIRSLEWFEPPHQGRRRLKKINASWQGPKLKSFTVESHENIIVYSKTFLYDAEGHCTWESINGECDTAFRYENGKLIEKVDPQGLITRYSYDSAGLLSSLIIGDGEKNFIRQFFSYDEQDCLIETITDDGPEGTERRITRFKRLKTGLIEEETESALDFATGEEVLIRRTQSEYDAYSNLVRQGEKTWEYDAAGRLLKSCDGLETKFFSYTVDGKVEEECLVKEGEPINCTRYSYDKAGRLIAARGRSYTYNQLGQVISACDEEGNETFYEYDALGRLKTISYPLVPGRDGGLMRPKEEFINDLFGNRVSVKDPGGHLTRTEYNIFGKPTHILYADGSSEHYTYSPGGLVLSKIDAHNIKTEYDYDPLGRVIKKTENGKMSTYSYSSFRLTEANGTKYSYDAAGRLKQESKGLDWTEYFYDECGQVVKTEEWVDGALYMVLERGKIFDAAGKILREEGEFPEPKVSTLTTETMHDALKRTTRITRKNSLQEVVDDVEFTYDLCGNKASETHGLFMGDARIGSFKIEWHYGPKNRLERVQEISHGHVIRKTEYLYNDNGLLKAIVKPDGKLINIFYNGLGKIERVRSSDNSVDYRLEYDKSGNIVKAVDLIAQKETHREYDEDGHLTHEALANGFTLSSAYDARGRRTKLTMPDQTSVRYEYDPLYLRAATRLDPGGRPLYRQEYSDFDLQGNLLEAVLPNNLGKIDYRYEKNGLLSSLKTPWFEDEYLKFDQDLPIKRRLEGQEIDYAYDAKGQITQESETAYEYDTMGNRLSDHMCTYDINGNLIKKVTADGKCQQFAYDALDRLTKVFQNEELLAEYIYDPFHRRIEKRVKGKTSRFFWDGPHEIGSDEGEMRVLGATPYAEIGATSAIELQGAAYLPLHDLTGSIRSLVSMKDGRLEGSYSGTCFGKEDSCSGVLSPWRFCGKRVDEETGFVLFGRRYLDPDLGRWISLDPFGYQDGANRFLFALNNPLLHKDPSGLFLLDFFSMLWDLAAQLYNFKEDMAQSLQQIAGIERCFEDEIATILEAILGKELLGLAGYYNERPEYGVYGQGEPVQNVRITLINGVANLRVHFRESMEHVLRTHGGSNIHYIFRPTKGWCWDMINGFMIKLGYTSAYAEQLASMWKDLIEDMGGVNNGGLIIHYCHSLGGSDTAAAVELLTEEERKMIRVYSFGSASMLSSSAGFESVTNFISIRDGIILFDPFRIFGSVVNDESNIVFVGTIFGPPLIDHMLISDTYVEIIRMLGLKYMKTYGG